MTDDYSPSEYERAKLAGKVMEPEKRWPDEIALVATWREGKKTKVEKIVIAREDFFGERGGSPMSGDQLIYAVNRLRKMQRP
jgi:hypothetical protein